MFKIMEIQSDSGIYVISAFIIEEKDKSKKLTLSHRHDDYNYEYPSIEVKKGNTVIDFWDNEDWLRDVLYPFVCGRTNGDDDIMKMELTNKNIKELKEILDEAFRLGFFETN